MERLYLKATDRPAWTQAKQQGDDGEARNIALLQKIGFAVTQNMGYASHDLDVTGSVEVKHDRMAMSSGNCAIEIQYRNKPSGVVTSTAGTWSIVVGDMAILVRTTTLRALAFSGKYRQVPAGENARVVLIPVSDVRAAGISLNLPVGGWRR